MYLPSPAAVLIPAHRFQSHPLTLSVLFEPSTKPLTSMLPSSEHERQTSSEQFLNVSVTVCPFYWRALNHARMQVAPCIERKVIRLMLVKFCRQSCSSSSKKHVVIVTASISRDVITAPCSLYIYSCLDKKAMRDVEIEGPAAVSMQLLKSVKTDICDFE
jgi:hypothetical protein